MANNLNADSYILGEALNSHMCFGYLSGYLLKA